jgi:ribosomal protein S18 acetylase RimI-like enzyme
MSSLIQIDDRPRIEAYLRREHDLHIYELGDLDDFFWPRTRWYALDGPAGIEASALLYTGTDLPVLIAMAGECTGPMRGLLHELRPALPRRLYAHLSDGLVDLLAPEYTIASHGRHLRMVLTTPEQVDHSPTLGAVPLRPEDLDAIRHLYDAAYPGNWFDPRMLETGAYHGIRQAGELIGIAGVHVFSPSYRVAALGNIATHPLHRGRGIGRAVTAAVCLWLRGKADTIGLNVHETNTAAIHCYERLGFSRRAVYEEFMMVRGQSTT